MKVELSVPGNEDRMRVTGWTDAMLLPEPSRPMILSSMILSSLPFPRIPRLKTGPFSIRFPARPVLARFLRTGTSSSASIPFICGSILPNPAEVRPSWVIQKCGNCKTDPNLRPPHSALSRFPPTPSLLKLSLFRRPQAEKTNPNCLPSLPLNVPTHPTKSDPIKPLFRETQSLNNFRPFGPLFSPATRARAFNR